MQRLSCWQLQCSFTCKLLRRTWWSKTSESDRACEKQGCHSNHDRLQDEPFHVPQTQRYCAGLFSQWDPKITTFPGLYFVGTAWAKLLQLAPLLHLPDQVSMPHFSVAVWYRMQHWGKPKLAAQGNECGTTVLRSTNLALGLVCLYVLGAVYKELHPTASSHVCTQTVSHIQHPAVCIALLPSPWPW